MENNTMRIGAKIGAVVGVAVWTLFGILAGFYFGGYGAISIMSKLVGGPIEATLISRVVVVCGMLIGIFSMGTVCLVIGSLLGTLVGWVISPIISKQLVTNK